MVSEREKRDCSSEKEFSRTLSVLLWLSLSAGWTVSTFSVIEEMCMVSACRDTASFTIFGLNMGWFGVAYFTTVLIVLWRRKRDHRLDWILYALVFSGIGAELRLLWIQKFVIGGWCPLCVTICCALFFAGMFLAIEMKRSVEKTEVKSLIVRLFFAVAMSAIGLAVAVVGVKALY